MFFALALVGPIAACSGSSKHTKGTPKSHKHEQGAKGHHAHESSKGTNKGKPQSAKPHSKHEHPHPHPHGTSKHHHHDHPHPHLEGADGHHHPY